MRQPREDPNFLYERELVDVIDGAAALESQRVPNTLVEAQQCSDSSRWKEAMEVELQSLREYRTWYLAQAMYECCRTGGCIS